MFNRNINREFDVRRLVKATTDKRGRQLKPFETLEQAQKKLCLGLCLLCDNSDEHGPVELVAGPSSPRNSERPNRTQ
jgi:hypothetical protein